MLELENQPGSCAMKKSSPTFGLPRTKKRMVEKRVAAVRIHRSGSLDTSDTGIDIILCGYYMLVDAGVDDGPVWRRPD